ncbi:hypothetical protein [Spirillospora sp. CA-128828]|uniref:hypothetical protein n=1 Tax=Spirillospora sp. CA-128828 TaxID=3240033 RepID=UPI003D943E45
MEFADVPGLHDRAMHGTAHLIRNSLCRLFLCADWIASFEAGPSLPRLVFQDAYQQVSRTAPQPYQEWISRQENQERDEERGI